MTTDIQTFQVRAVELLDALYKDGCLSVTPAITQINNRVMPSLKSLLHTIQHYSEVEKVIAFVDANAELIAKAKQQVEDERAASDEAVKKQIKPELRVVDASELLSELKMLEDYEASRKPFELIKKHALSDIEQELSVLFSKLCDAEMVVSIESLTKTDHSNQANIQIAINPPALKPLV